MVKNKKLLEYYSPKDISGALDNKDSRVRLAAIKNVNANKEHLHRALEDSDVSVRREAIKHGNISREHLNKAINDSDPEVRKAAINHAKASKEHIQKGMNDSDYSVRHAAIMKDAEKSKKVPKKAIPKSAAKDAAPISLRNKISRGLHKAVNIATRPEFGKYGKNLKTADDVIAYYGHGLANLIGGKNKEVKSKEKNTSKVSQPKASGEFKSPVKPTKPLKALPSPIKRKLLTGPKPLKALPSPEKRKLLNGPEPQNARSIVPKPFKTPPVSQSVMTKSTAVGRPLPMQKRLPSAGEKVVGSGQSIGAKTQGMSKPVKMLSAPQKKLPVLQKESIETYKDILQEYSMKQFGSDVADTARGVAKGVTFGASDNIEAGAKSLFKGTSYKSELGKARQANAAAQKRSPTLYGAGEIAGAIAAPVPGAAAIKGISAATKIGKAAKVGAHIGSSMATQSAVDKVKSIAEPKIGTMVRPNKPQPAFKAPVTKQPFKSPTPKKLY